MESNPVGDSGSCLHLWPDLAETNWLIAQFTLFGRLSKNDQIEDDIIYDLIKNKKLVLQS